MINFDYIDHSFDVCWHQWVKAQLLHWNHELSQLAFVGLHHVSVGSSDLLQLVLQLSNHVVFAVLYLFDGLAYGSNGSTVDVCSLEHLVKLKVLDLQFL